MILKNLPMVSVIVFLLFFVTYAYFTFKKKVIVKLNKEVYISLLFSIIISSYYIALIYLTQKNLLPGDLEAFKSIWYYVICIAPVLLYLSYMNLNRSRINYFSGLFYPYVGLNIYLALIAITLEIVIKIGRAHV